MDMPVYGSIYELDARADIVTAMDVIANFFNRNGKLIEYKLNGYVKGKIKRDGWLNPYCSFEIFMKESGGYTHIRFGSVYYGRNVDAIWDKILTGIYKELKTDAIPGKPFIVGAIQRSSDIETKTFRKQSGGISFGGMLIGGLLGGTWGAVVGGSLGKERNTVKKWTRMATTILYTLKYSNGRILDKYVVRDSKEYNEIVIAQK